MWIACRSLLALFSSVACEAYLASCGGVGSRRKSASSPPVRIARANGIEVEEHLVSVTKGEHKKPEYKAVNPMGLVPAIDDNGFHLFESHAILRYLACAYPNVKDHWYPVDLRKRAKIDCILDWHHTNLRRGSDPHAASEAELLLKASLKTIETLWLTDDGSFLTGSSQPSIADLSLACEVTQLQLLDKENASELLDPNPKVKKWLDAVEKTLAPHFAQVHETLQKTSQKRRGGEPNKEEAVTQPKL